MKHVLIITGYPGSGKTTLSKFIEANSCFSHVDYDLYHTNPVLLAQKETDYIIFDGVHFNTERLAISLDYFNKKGYEITVIYLNTNKNRCLNNIVVRNRPTISMDELNISYDFNLLRKSFVFNLIQVTDYKLDNFNSRYQTNIKIFAGITNIMKLYENKNGHGNTTRNTSKSISGQSLVRN